MKPNLSNVWTLLSGFVIFHSALAQEARLEGLVSVWGQYTIPPARLTNIKRVAAGNDWSLAVDGNGKAFFWGRTSQTGDEAGVLPDSLSSNIVDVAAGVYGLALKDDGTPILWGRNNYVPDGRLVADAGLNNLSKIISGRHEELWGIKNDHTAVAITSSYIPMCPFPNWTGVVDIAPQAVNWNCASWGYGLVLFDDGRVESYGQRNGQPVIVAPEAQGSKALVAGDYTGLVLKNNGMLVGWSIIDGNTNSDIFGISLVPPPSATNIVAIAAGAFHYLALRADGTVVTWGGLSGGIDTPAGLSNVVQISAGVRHSLALKSDGTVVAWGHPAAVGVMPGDRAVKVATADQDIYLVRKDGTVGHMGITPVPEGLTNIVDIDTDASGTLLALKADGQVVTWSSGITPVPDDVANVVAVAAGGVNFAGSSLNVALRSDHTIYAWAQFAPTIFPPDGFPAEHALQNYPEIRSIDAGQGNIIAVTEAGQVRVWAGGILNPPPDLTNVVAAAIGGAHGLVLKNDGTVVAWGNPVGGLPPVAEWTNIVKIAAASVFCAGCRNVTGSVALRADGTVLNWGGTFAPPPDLSGVFDITTSGYTSGALYLPPAPPAIAGYCPPSANAGEVVRVEGAGFLPVSSVRVNGQPAEFKRDFNFVLHVTVPPGASTGPIEVTSPYGTATTKTSLVVPNGLTPIETWRVLNFGNPADSGNGADLTDPDGDGVPNLHEYALHTDPNIADRTVALSGRRVVEVNGQRYFEFAVRRYELASDISYHYEYKLDMAEPWKPYTGDILDAATESLAGCQSQNAVRRCLLPDSTTRFYLRYSITRP